MSRHDASQLSYVAPMHNKILWTLDTEMSWDCFERLCTDMLGREGYEDIIPIGGTKDRGRDAELRHRGIKSTGGVTFFQYTLDKKWEGKLKRELVKTKNNKHIINYYVFVTTQKVSGNKRDGWVAAVAQKYKWHLVIYDREWFRHRLEERHTDLAAKYLGITPTADLSTHSTELKPPASEDDASEKAWQLYIQGKFEAASVELKVLLLRDSRNAKKWQALAWCQYSLHHYDEALVSIERAISIDKNDQYGLSIKACILAEDGIQRGIKANLLLARDIFIEIAKPSKQWVDHYNYGNVLQALGDYVGAKAEFITAIDYDPQQASIWKNLGGVYYLIGDHEKEINCYDRALAINSQLTEALISKGVTLFKIYDNRQESALLIERAITIDESIKLKWPHAYHWLALIYYKRGDYKEALKAADAGLAAVPAHSGLLDVKASILSRLWRETSAYIDTATSFFKFRVELLDSDYASFTELMQLLKASGQNDEIIIALEKALELEKGGLTDYLSYTEHSIDELLVSAKYLPNYKIFRSETSPIKRYTKLLTESNVMPDTDFEKAMFTVCAIPFGLACDILTNRPRNERHSALPLVKDKILKSLSASMPGLATKLVNNIKRDSTKAIAEGLSSVVVIWPDIALLELSGQLGYIGGSFGVSPKELDNAVIKKGENLGEWQKNIFNASFFEINKKLQIFKE